MDRDAGCELASILSFVVAVFPNASEEQRAAACTSYLARRGKAFANPPEGQAEIIDVAADREGFHRMQRTTLEDEFKAVKLTPFQLFVIEKDF